ncbi:glycosyltransferase family 4 protein [Candidatus Daviesbacteria bacterium]|nr:glycosyltransferase family 4 protein [Candidatus Daviesbacteria bacterium]
MNILLISPYFSPAVGGVETHLTDLCKYLVSKKHQVFVRTYKAMGVKNRGETEEEGKFLKIHRFWWPDFNLIFKLEKYPVLKFLYLFTGLFFDCFIFMIKNSKKIDVIQSHGFIAAMMGVILGKLFNKRVVINTHVGFRFNKGFMTEIIKWTLLNSDKILVLTTGIKKSLVNLGIPEKKIDIYHYWVDQRIFKRQKNGKEKLGWKDKFIVLFVGRLIEVKGVKKIFDLAKVLKDMRFVIIGLGPLAHQLKQKSSSYKNVEFVGKIDNENLPLYYSAADILLIPSQLIEQEYGEGIPRVMIEALSCGLPVISTKSGAISDIFSDRIGILVEDDIESMRKAIEKFYKNKIYYQIIAENCRRYALNHFSINNAHIIEESLFWFLKKFL